MDFLDFFKNQLADFNTSTDLIDFLINALVATLLSLAVKSFYVRFGNAISNRKRFAANFVLLALATMLIFSIVKGSFALAIGLVGALSIVRFRAAIKDPEELTYLFLIIGIGLSTGDSQPILAIVATVAILLLLFIVKKIGGKKAFKSEDNIYVNITTDLSDVDKFAAILTSNFKNVELKRLDQHQDMMQLSFLCKAESLSAITSAQKDIKNASASTTFSIIDQPDLVG